MIEILTSGLLNSVQDLGRPGHLNSGVARSGAMDREALIIANRMIGNPDTAAGLEISLFPFRLKFLADTNFAVTGAFGTIRLNSRVLPGWWASSACEGDILTIDLPDTGARSYIAISGGVATAPVLGSRATDLKSGFGGLEGRGLKRGDILPTGPSHPAVKSPRGAGFGMDATVLRPEQFGHQKSSNLTLRIITAAEHDAFTAVALSAFYEADWEVSPEANRQGFRLNGPMISLSRSHELFSHGIMPGTVQVPPSGQPVIQLADANTCGGYPKIACVITADLWKLGQSGAGQKLRFEAVDRHRAVEALKQQNRLMDEMRQFAELARRDKVGATHD